MDDIAEIGGNDTQNAEFEGNKTAPIGCLSGEAVDTPTSVGRPPLGSVANRLLNHLYWGIPVLNLLQKNKFQG